MRFQLQEENLPRLGDKIYQTVVLGCHAGIGKDSRSQNTVLDPGGEPVELM